MLEGVLAHSTYVDCSADAEPHGFCLAVPVLGRLTCSELEVAQGESALLHICL